MIQIDLDRVKDLAANGIGRKQIAKIFGCGVSTLDTYLRTQGLKFSSFPKPTKNPLSEMNPAVAAQWHPTKNGERTPQNTPHMSNYRSRWLCHKGHEWEAVVSSRGRNGCPECGNKKVNAENCLAATHPELVKEWHPTLNAKTPFQVTFGSEYRAYWLCPVNAQHVYDTQVIARSSHDKTGCPFCVGKRVDGTNSLVGTVLEQEFDLIKNAPVLPSEVVRGSGTIYWWKCSVNERHEWQASPTNRTRFGHGCPQCSGRVATDENNLLVCNPELSAQWHPTKNGDLKPNNMTPYSGVKVWWECPNNKQHVWFASISGRTQGRGCSKCSHRISKAQGQVADFVTKLGFEVELNNTKILLADRKEIDVWVPSKRLAIEYNGLFFHSSYRGLIRGREVRKFQACLRAGVSLFMIFEDEWLNKQPIIESMIGHRLGTSKERIGARDTLCREIAKEEWMPFLERCHLDGNVRANQGFGLFLDDRLIGCLTLRKNFSGELEIARMAFELHTSVAGGAQKLISKCPRPLVTFSNNRFSVGDVYSKVGFKEITETEQAGYFYTDFKQRIPRFQCKRINTPEAMAIATTEIEQCRLGVQSQKIFGDSRPLYRIEDCGHRKWLLE